MLSWLTRPSLFQKVDSDPGRRWLAPEPVRTNDLGQCNQSQRLHAILYQHNSARRQLAHEVTQAWQTLQEALGRHLAWLASIVRLGSAQRLFDHLRRTRRPRAAGSISWWPTRENKYSLRAIRPTSYSFYVPDGRSDTFSFRTAAGKS